jgi:hypothetical protein
MKVTVQPVSFGVGVIQVGREQDAGTQRVRALVIGTDTFCSDEALAKQRAPETSLHRIGGLLDFVRGRPQGLNIAPGTFRVYSLPKEVSSTGLIYLPASIIFFGIMALGAGVWIARRR